MKVSDIMSRDVRLTSPDDTIRQAAAYMAQIDVGALPVGENDRLVGMITDRDIAIRGVAAGKPVDAKVRDVMTPDIKYCYEDEEVDDVVRNMGDIKVRRLPVVNLDKRLTGMLSLGDVALYADSSQAGTAIGDISAPGGPHTQTR